jgi:hypothetical protein
MSQRRFGLRQPLLVCYCCFIIIIIIIITNKQNKLNGLSPQANYTDRAAAAFRGSDCQLLRIKGATWSAWRIPTAVFSIF